MAIYGSPNSISPAGATFAGSTSGSTILKASAVASGTLTLPAATDTLVGKATTDTLTNKTLTTPTIASFTNATHDHTNAAGGGTLTLAGAAFANQGTTTTVLHGNVAGNPSFGAVSLTADVSGDLPFANLTQGSALSVLGVTGNSTADVASIVASTDNQVLRRSGTSIAFGAVNLASSNAVAGALPAANGGTGLSALGTALQQLRVNAGATALEYFTASAGITNSAGAGVVPKSDGTNLVASEITSEAGAVTVISQDAAIFTAGSISLGNFARADPHLSLDLDNNQAQIGTGHGATLYMEDADLYLAGAEVSLTTSQIKLSATVTAGGTTGAQTINQAAGSVNFAAAATSLVVTNSTVAVSSIIICTVATNDATLKSVQCVAGSGAFTMFGNAAAAAEARVNFWVITPQ